MSTIRRIAFATAAVFTALALVPSNANAATPVQPMQQRQAVFAAAKTVVTVATVQDLAPAMTTTAQRGEGVIRITTRICGNANNWQAVAAANNIRPPVYLVLLGQKMVVTCVAGSAPAPVPQQQAPPAATATGWVAPVRACISSGYGWRWGTMHYGTDLSAAYGTAIRAAAAGTVSVAYQAGGAGYYTMINHGGGLWTVYMHQSSFAVRSGWVGAGQTIGYVGSTGNSTGAHLHFEVHPGGLWNRGAQVDPVPFMAARGARLGC